MKKTFSCCQIPTRMSSPAPMIFPPIFPAVPWWKFQWRATATPTQEGVRQKALSDRKNLNLNTAWNSFSPEELEIKTKLCELISELNPMD